MLMSWIFMVVPLYIAYYTITYAKMLWDKENNKFAATFTILIALSIIALPIWLKLR